HEVVDEPLDARRIARRQARRTPFGLRERGREARLGRRETRRVDRASAPHRLRLAAELGLRLLPRRLELGDCTAALGRGGPERSHEGCDARIEARLYVVRIAHGDTPTARL